MPDRVPFVDLRRQHRAIAEELRAAFDRVLEAGAFILGEEVARFEEEFAAYCGVRHCVGVASGTAAITIALKAAGIGRGDEVIVPAHTYIASALGVLHAGAEPVFCDVDESTGLIDADSAAASSSERTVAVLAVHLYGQTCDMEPIHRFAAGRGLMVIEDAAQAHGAKHGSGRAGSLGDVAAFSFYPSKNLGALGDGGAICTDDPALAAAARRWRHLGQERKGEHLVAGFNERLDGLQAAVLRVKLGHLDTWNEKRRRVADRYREALGGSVEVLDERQGGDCVYHIFPVRTPERDELVDRLEHAGVEVGMHYCPAVPDQAPFAQAARLTRAGYPRVPVELPRAARWAEEELSLPMFAELDDREVSRVAGVVTGGRLGIGAR